MFVIEEELKKLPTGPGVYMHKDNLGEVIYVGKAVNLKSRVRSYFNQKTSQSDPKMRALVSNIAEFDYMTCASEMEALILECNLIKKYTPKYNVLLKDDKTYPYIQITKTEDFPRLLRTRRLVRDGNQYFGPYTNSGAILRIIKMIEEIYPLKKCRQTSFKAGVRPCLNYFIGKCKGVCIGKISKEEYEVMIREIIDILSGQDSDLIASLESRMNDASEKMEYEDAAKYRDYLTSLRQLGEIQRASMVKDRDIDILVPVITDKTRVVAQYKVRDGKLNSREITYVREEADYGGKVEKISENTKKNSKPLIHDISLTPGKLLSIFLKQHYLGLTMLPREILMPYDIEEKNLLEKAMNKVNMENVESGNDVLHKTYLVIPERGEKKALMKMAIEDSVELAKSLDERAERDKDRKNKLRKEIAEIIEKACNISGNPAVLISEGDEREYRIEAYDISNLNGLDTVGAMVVYEGKKPVKKDYRKFRIRTSEGDDYGSIRETLYRRFKRALKGDKGFSKYPDIIFIDGGLGHVRAAKAVIDAFRIGIPVVGLVKDDFHRTRAIVFEDGSEIELIKRKLLFTYCGNIQEEVHRFAITYMSGVRGKRMIKSALEEIPGVGPKRRTALLSKFGNIEAIKKASLEELLSVKGMNSKVAEEIKIFFNEKN
ncbi:MAG TPA: excinuclease ABC subunit UvrC [Mogibacterium sp.]|nr:excinuclease ABC subunit UvrC [Mogibacterium sp.]